LERGVKIISGDKVKEIIKKKIQASIEVKRNLKKHLIPEIEKAALKIKEALINNKKLLLCGNGGSAADAQHIACEFIEKVRVNRKAFDAIALNTNTSIITAVANDRSFEEIFSRQIEGIGKKGDLLIAISTSGNSKNVVKAVNTAKNMGIYTIGLLGKNGGILKNIVDIPLIVPSDNTARIQESHILIGHILIEIMEEEFVA